MKPALLQELLHGKVLTKKVFPFFVETWNYIIHRVDNIRGDKDENANTGYITVDNANPESPVIRFSPPTRYYTFTDSENISSTLSSLERTSISGTSYIGLYDFSGNSTIPLTGEKSKYSVVTRYNDLGQRKLKYIPISSLMSDVSGDANINDDTKSIVTNIVSGDVTRISLHNFGIPLTNTTDENSFSLYTDALRKKYYNGDTVTLSCRNPAGDDARFIMKGRGNDGKNEVKYSDLRLTLPKYGIGDSKYGNTKSISSYLDGDNPIHLLYNFTSSKDNNICVLIGNYADYYYNGATELQTKLNDNTDNFDVVLRVNDSGKYIDYAKLKITTSPFVHADGDGYDGDLTSKSIETKYNFTDPTKTYYQLYGFDGGYSSNSIEITSAYVNLASGTLQEEESEGSRTDFLVRNRDTGKLEYTTLYVKCDTSSGEGGWQEERITNIENNITNVEGDITEIQQNITIIEGEVTDLSGRMDLLSNDFWCKGGSSSDCYGGAIGNEDQEEVINLDSKTLWGNWTTEGSMTIGNTTLTENTLKQLIALLNSSQNVLQQSY